MLPRPLKHLNLAARNFRNWVASLNPARWKRAHKAKRARLAALACFDRISRKPLNKDATYPRNVLVDGLWDNPNYWLRYALVRRALGLWEGRETGLLGPYSRNKVRASFAALGIDSLLDYRARAKCFDKHMDAAEKLLRGVKVPGDLLAVQFPYAFPASLVFDAILKRQRRATVDLFDPDLREYVAEVLAHLEAANHMVEEGQFDLIVLSHALDYTYSAIAWAAIQRGIPVLVLYGDYGTARFFRLKEPADLFAYPGRPSLEEMNSMAMPRQDHLREQGAALLHARLTGKTDDVGSVYAYQKRNAAVTKVLLAERFGWDPSKPIIGVYNSNWFDYPHASGLQGFRDFLDWIEQTLEVARTHDKVNWLFKAHPCDDWYASIRGTRLEDLVAAANLPHIQLVDKSWNGLDLIKALDGIVTCHGTIGIEATSLGTPVLVPYPGWYGHAGFVAAPKSREKYLAKLRTEWWTDMDKDRARADAELFAGWMFCVPEWQSGFVLQDDSRQDVIYAGIPAFLDSNAVAIEREVQEIEAWVEAGQRFYHIFKVSRASVVRPLTRVTTSSS